MIKALAQVTERTYIDREGKEQNWLTKDEYEMLSIRKKAICSLSASAIEFK